MDSLLLAGIVSSIDHLLGFTAVVTAAAASVARYAVVLTNPNRRRLEPVTAYGFHFGFLAAIALFALDLALS